MEWAIIGLLVAAVALVYLRFSHRFASNRRLVIEQTGGKWYRYAFKEISSERGREFLRKHFAETVEPDRVRTESQRAFVQTAALGVYLRLLDENGRDATHYDTLPIEPAALEHARVVSRLAIHW